MQLVSSREEGGYAPDERDTSISSRDTYEVSCLFLFDCRWHFDLVAPITPRPCNSQFAVPLWCRTAIVLSLLRQFSTSGFPVPVLQRGLVVMTRVSSTSRNMTECLFSRRPFVGYNRNYFPGSGSCAIMRNNNAAVCWTEYYRSLNSDILSFAYFKCMLERNV